MTKSRSENEPLVVDNTNNSNTSSTSFVGAVTDVAATGALVGLMMTPLNRLIKFFQDSKHTCNQHKPGKLGFTKVPSSYVLIQQIISTTRFGAISGVQKNAFVHGRREHQDTIEQLLQHPESNEPPRLALLATSAAIASVDALWMNYTSVRIHLKWIGVEAKATSWPEHARFRTVGLPVRALKGMPGVLGLLAQSDIIDALPDRFSMGQKEIAAAFTAGFVTNMLYVPLDCFQNRQLNTFDPKSFRVQSAYKLIKEQGRTAFKGCRSTWGLSLLSHVGLQYLIPFAGDQVQRKVTPRVENFVEKVLEHSHEHHHDPRKMMP